MGARSIPTARARRADRRSGRRSRRGRSTTASAIWPTPSASTRGGARARRPPRRPPRDDRSRPASGTRQPARPSASTAERAGGRSGARPVDAGRRGRRRGRPGCRDAVVASPPDATSSAARRAAPCPSPTPRSSRTTASSTSTPTEPCGSSQLTGTGAGADRRRARRGADRRARRRRDRGRRGQPAARRPVASGRPAAPPRSPPTPADPWRRRCIARPGPCRGGRRRRSPCRRPHAPTRLPAGIGVTAAVCTLVGSVVVAARHAVAAVPAARRRRAARLGRHVGRRPRRRAHATAAGPAPAMDRELAAFATAVHGAACRPLAAPPRNDTDRRRGRSPPRRPRGPTSGRAVATTSTPSGSRSAGAR